MATDAPTLLAASACYNNYSAQSWLLKLGLLRQIVLSLNPMAATDPQSLLNSAQCYNCYGPGTWPLLELQLLNLIVTNGTGGGGGTANLFQNFGGVAPAASGTAVGQWAVDSSTGKGWMWSGTAWVQIF